MNKLFLSSSFVDVAEFLEPFVGEKLKYKTITFIPTASIPEEYKGYVENDRKAFEKLGLIVQELEISTASQEMIKETIAKNDFIYVSGGNTFYLLQELKKSGADKIIISEIKKGKVYIGASAGSVIMSKNIEYVEKMDDKTKAENLPNYNALNAVDFYTLPHHTNEPFKNSVEEVINEYENQIKLIPISNTQVIQVEGAEMSIIGNK
ncbi:Type 1 glutamine amidotransferase-like domain-containing protein [Tenacibaculum finnmarkense]|uniref:Type 1 glutamine amidotransferase-like domain-containing protein n=1 Tax=Tenacibaculum finnmarkense TaxID=2781243 RepID=UPI001EFAC761|nr:Type 1 glutamine amidotransferase-like domain-containing protein [Tenacibaculum finnmarkense]MCG8804001.1 type 1 glutamine amidotransferase-like domain-containing protein [Tenacibaculum finnmarkense]MCG8826731.1 type 1 glutamine amidotransferase-like domain-containing protein [Tenacibaculum finnmarkense]